MKRAAYIFILLFCFGFKLFSAKTEHVFALKQLSYHSKYENTSKEKSPIFIKKTKDYPSSYKIISEKKIRQRGLETVYYLFINKCPLIVELFEKKWILSSQNYYFLFLFSGNEKRGPPIAIAF